LIKDGYAQHWIAEHRGQIHKAPFPAHDHERTLVLDPNLPEQRASHEVRESQKTDLNERNIRVISLMQAAFQPALLGRCHQTADALPLWSGVAPNCLLPIP
jgi:hypothetical protein